MKSLKMRRPLILLSGGPDSATLTAVARREAYDSIETLYLKAGHGTDAKELLYASMIAKSVGSDLFTIDVSSLVASLGSNRLAGHFGAPLARFGTTIMYSMALGVANNLDCDAILVALHKDDTILGQEYTVEYVGRVNDLAKMVSNHSPSILLPFSNLTKAEIFSLGLSMGVDYANSWSCTNSWEVHCGSCQACQARRRAFQINNISDPTLYEFNLQHA